MVAGVYNQTTQPSLIVLIMRSVISTLSRALESRANATVPVRSRFQGLVRNMLSVAAFTLWTIAAFSYTFMVGMIVAGICCMLCAWQMNGNSSSSQ